MTGCGICFKYIWFYQKRACLTNEGKKSYTDGIVCHNKCISEKNRKTKQKEENK